MTTALDFTEAGVVFTRSLARIVARVPKGRADLAADLRAEVERRVPKLGGEKMARDLTLPRGRCETCADPLANGRGGNCWLCVAARSKALAAWGWVRG